MTRQVTDNLYIDLDYFTPEEYYVYEALAEAALSSTASIDCTADVIGGGIVKEFDAVLTSVATQTTDINVIADFSVSLQSTTSVTAQTDKLIGFSANWSGVFSPTMTAIAIKNLGSSVNVVATISATPVANRSTAITLASIANVNSQAIKFVETSATLQATFTQATTGNRVNRVVGDPTVNVDGLYGQLAFDSTIKKFGTHSLKFLENNNNQLSVTTNFVYTGTKIFGLRVTQTNYYNTGYSETTNGNTWTSGTTDIVRDSNLPINRVEFLNNRLVAWYDQNSASIYNSTNGGTVWSKQAGATYTTHDFNDLAYTGTHYIRVGYNTVTRGSILRSTDLVNWSPCSYTAGALTSTTEDIGAASRITVFNSVAVGGSTIVAVATINRVDTGAADSNYLFYSTNHGADWTGVTSSPVSANVGLNGVAFGNNLWVIVGRNGDIFTASAPNSTWTKRTSGVTATLNHVSYSNGLWIVTGSGNTLLTSSDGVTWTQRTVTFTAQQRAFYANSRWWVGIWTSTDGATWTSSSNTALTASLPKSAEIVFADNPDWNSWKTVDFWIYMPTRNGNESPILYIEGTNTLYAYSWRVGVTAAGTGILPSLFYRTADGSTIQGDSAPLNQVVAYNQWNHFRIVNDGGRISLYANGNRIDTNTGFSNSYFDTTGVKIYTLGPSADLRIDELLISDTALTDPTATSFTVPTTEYVNNDNTDLLLHFNNTYLDDNVAPPKTISLSAQLTSAFTQTAQNRYDAVGTAQLTSAFTQTASAEKVVLANADLASAFTQTVDYTRIKQFDSDLPAIATQLTAVAKIGDFLVACDNTATLTATAEVTRTVDSNLTSTATQTTLAVATLEGEVDLTSQFTQTAQETITRTADSQLSTQATVNASATVTKTLDSALSTQAQLTATAVKTVKAESAQQAQAQISVDTNVNKPFSANLPTLATQLTAAAKIGVTLVDCAVVSTLTADAISGKIVIANLNSNAELTNTVEVTRTTNAQLTVTAQQTAVNARLRASAVALSTQAQLTVDATSTKFADADLTAQFTVQAKPGGLQYAQANLSTQAQIQANATATKSAVAVLPTIGTQLAIGTETSTLSANLSATFTLVANVIEIRIDPDLTYMIPRETRTQMIADEWRDDIVIPESRSYEIVKELRDYAVANTEETYII
jgi:hypothetical protein